MKPISLVCLALATCVAVPGIVAGLGPGSTSTNAWDFDAHLSDSTYTGDIPASGNAAVAETAYTVDVVDPGANTVVGGGSGTSTAGTEPRWSCTISEPQGAWPDPEENFTLKLYAGGVFEGSCTVTVGP